MKDGFPKKKLMANALRRYRRMRGLTQRQAARILGLKSPSMISHWERGACVPDGLNLFRLAVLYRTMVEALYGEHLQMVRAELTEREEQYFAELPASAQSVRPP